MPNMAYPEWGCPRCGKGGMTPLEYGDDYEDRQLAAAHRAHNAASPDCSAFDDSPVYHATAPDPEREYGLFECTNHRHTLVQFFGPRCTFCGVPMVRVTDPERLMTMAEGTEEGSRRQVLADEALYYRMRRLDPAFARRWAHQISRGAWYR